MRNSIGSTRAFVKKCTKGRPVAASSGGVATCFLTLPFISQNVPFRSVHEENDRKWLQAAKLCAELVGDDELVINSKTTARDIISQSLSVWASRHCADIQVLDSFELLAALDHDAFDLDYEQKPEKDLLLIGIQSQQATPYINVKAKVERLEAEYPGLGRTAIIMQSWPDTGRSRRLRRKWHFITPHTCIGMGRTVMKISSKSGARLVMRTRLMKAA